MLAALAHVPRPAVLTLIAAVVACSPRTRAVAAAAPTAGAATNAARPIAPTTGGPIAAAPTSTPTTGAPTAAAPPAGAPRDGGCSDATAPYDVDALRAQIGILASPALDGRASGSPGDVAARRHIAGRFRQLGLVPGGTDGGYEQPFVADGRATANVVGYLRGSDARRADEIIVVGAHHDHVGNGHLGANDNASGVVALLAIAHAVCQAGAPARTIAFVAFGGEELGLLGARHFTAHPPAALPLDRVVYNVNLDMVGSHRSAGAVYAMGTFRDQPATAIVTALRAAYPSLRVRTGGRGAGSDHEPFCSAGVPYVFFWTPDRRCYHKRCDTADRIDAANLGQIASLAGALVAQLADSPDDLALVRGRNRRGCAGPPARWR